MMSAKQLEVVVVPTPLPNSLIYYPCEPIGAGNTTESLAKAYVENTYCIGEYKHVLDGIAVYNKKQEGMRDAGKR